MIYFNDIVKLAINYFLYVLGNYIPMSMSQNLYISYKFNLPTWS